MEKGTRPFLVLQNDSNVYFLLFLNVYGNICIYTTLSLVYRLNCICNCLFKYLSSLVNNSCNVKSCDTYFRQWNPEDSPSTECNFVHNFVLWKSWSPYFCCYVSRLFALIYSLSCEVLRKFNCHSLQ